MAVLLGLALGSLTMLLAAVVGCALLLRAVGVVQAVLDDAQRSSRPTFNVHVRPSVTSLTVPGKFLEPKTQYELKLLALEVSGRQIVSVIHFTTQ